MPLLSLPVHFPNSNIPPHGPMAPIYPPLNRQELKEPINIPQNIKNIKHSQHTKLTIHKTTNSQTNKVIKVKAIRHREIERESHFSSKRNRERESFALTLRAQQSQRCKMR